MVFSSFTFLFYFLPIFFILYYIISPKFKNLYLFISSLIFYAWGEPIYVLLMLFSTINDYIFGRFIYKYNNKNKKISTFLLIGSISINLLLLFTFKYCNFFINIINIIPNIDIQNVNISLPIGISFYTFQTMSYSIDIYKEKSKPQNNIIDFGVYVSLFPQLIAGPIVVYNIIEKELKERTPELEKGVSLFIFGLSKKIILANNIGYIWENIINSSQSSILGNWFGIICYSLQIYYDFSGYSDMAIGLGYMLGFHFPQNFNYPYFATSITDFWRKWHITLGNWFRDYVYIPLGGNKKGLIKQIRNILIVWLLTGLWHGASANFVLWGLYYGILLIIEKIFLLKYLNKTNNIIKHIYTISLVLVGYVFFAIEDFSTIFIYLKNMFSGTFLNNNFIFLLRNNLILIIFGILFAFPCLKNIKRKISESTLIKIVLFIINISFLINSSYNPFLYFRF